MTRDEILNEIRRTAVENGGKSLGRTRFQQITGISEYEVSRHWRTWNTAVQDAGFEPNKLNAAHSADLLVGRFVGLTRQLGHVPTNADMRVARTNDPSFPDAKTYERLGRKNERIGLVLNYCRERPGNDDVIAILESAYVVQTSTDVALTEATAYGFVYLVKGHPGEFKIGRTNLVDRRLSELGATSSVEQQLIHEIKTDDPVGIEAYWHARFADKRMRGEWFKLSASDVKAFKRWKRIC